MMDVELPSQEGGDRTTARLLTERIVRGKRSSGMDAFCAYLRSRAKCAPYLSSFYQRTIFRRQRYDAWLGRKASFDRLVDRIKTTFGKGVTLLYGDWGRSPNMKHQPPSPGINFRRALAAQFPLYLVHESYTSSVCPSCHQRELSHPRQDKRGRDVHHLLKCCNPTCYTKWWERNRLGALNILINGKHAMKTGAWHPMFARLP